MCATTGGSDSARYFSINGWIPKPIRSSVFFLALGGRGPSMTDPLTQQSSLSTITYETIWGKNKETPLRSPYTYYAPLPNPLQFEYIAKSFQITDPRTGNRMLELPANRDADLIFDISISTEYSLYWINSMTPDRDGDGIGDACDTRPVVLHDISDGDWQWDTVYSDPITITVQLTDQDGESLQNQAAEPKTVYLE